MGVLKNPKHETFAQELAKGLTLVEAFVNAGYKANHGNAIRLRQYQTVRSRIDEIQAVGAARASITVQKVLEELALIGFANLADYLNTTDPKKPTVDLSNITRAQMAAVSEIRVDRFGVVKSLKLYDKRAALVDIGTALGMFKKAIEISGPDGGPIKTEDAQARAFILGEIQRLTSRKVAEDEANTIDVEANPPDEDED